MATHHKPPKPPRKHKVTMIPPSMIAFVNHSTLISDADVERIAHIVGEQGALHIAPIRGIVPATIFVPKGGQVPTNAAPCNFRDALDVPGALGYHDVDTSGNPFIEISCESLGQGGSVLSGPEAVSVTASHEYAELVGDPSANLWADGPDGVHDYAYELCDATEADVYELDGVTVSNFLYPAFFNPHSSTNARLDYMGVVKTPFETQSNGYRILRTEPGKVSQVFGHMGHLRLTEAKPGLFLHFGDAYPDSRKAAKIEKAIRRRGRRR